MKPVSVKVPATTANLGAGYDLIGMALSIYNHFHFQPAETLSLTLRGPRAAGCQFELSEESLIYRAFASVFQTCQLAVPNFSLEQEIHVPSARGLGSSATAIIAGLLAANHWLDEALDLEQILKLATELEGHPDNVTAALLGGCMLTIPDSGHCVEIPVPESLYWGVCIPAFELETRRAREVVPQSLSLADAISNMSYLGALISGFYRDEPTLIAQGLRDRIHQPYRQQLVPGMQTVMQAALSAGALGCVLSGAGPSLLAVSQEPLNEVGAAMLASWQALEIEAEFISCLIDQQGAHCLD